MFGGKRHVDDSALIRRYLADRGLEALEPRDEAVVRHLGRCAACDARYTEVRAAFDGAREAALDEAEAACTPERLDRQRERILRQIDGLSGNTRVLPFPAVAQGARRSGEHRVLARWVAAAAVIGLMVGLTAGRLLDLGGSTANPGVQRQASAVQSAPRGVAAIRPASADSLLTEDQFLSELELATSAPRAAELRAIYAFTLEEPIDASRPGKD